MPAKRAAEESPELTAPSASNTTTMEYTGATAWYFSTVAAYVPTDTLKSIFSLPFRTSDYLFQQQTHAPQPLRVQITTLEDGRSKKRLVDADPAMAISAGSYGSESGSSQLPSSQVAAASSEATSPPRVQAKRVDRWRERAALATTADANTTNSASPLLSRINTLRSKAEPGSRWRARAAEPATLINHTSPLLSHIALNQLRSKSEPTNLNNHASPLLSQIDTLRSKAEPGGRWKARASKPANLTSHTTLPPRAHIMTSAKQPCTAPLPVGLSPSVEDQIWRQPVTQQSDEDYLLSSPDSSPVARRTRVRFDNHVRVKPIAPRRKIPDDEYYLGDPDLNALIDHELNVRRKARERARERAQRTLEVEDGWSSSEFKEDVDIPPPLVWTSPKMLPHPWMYEEILDNEDKAVEEEAAEAAEVDAMLYSKEVAANTIANENIIDVDDADDELPRKPLKDYISNGFRTDVKDYVNHHFLVTTEQLDDVEDYINNDYYKEKVGAEPSAEDNDLFGGESSSEFKEDVGSSPVRPSTPIDQSMRYLKLAQEAVDDSVILASSPTPFPFASTTVTPLVAPLTDVELESLNKIAQHSAANDRAIVAELPTIKLTTHDFGTLVPTKFNGPAKGWLNDNIIDEYLDLLVGHIKQKEGYVHVRGKAGVAPPVHAFKSQWYTSMQKSTENTARWARPVNLSEKKLLDCGLVLIPICDNSHWRLVAIKPKERLIEYYDSLLGPGTIYTAQALEWVKLVLKEHYIEEEWSIVEDQKSEEQVNARDCGVFTVLNALVLLRGDEHNRVLVTDGMDDARLRIATSLIAGTPTTELD